METRNVIISLVMVLGFFCAGQSAAKTPASSDDQIRQQIIDESIADYPGTCACPFNQARNGSSCGGRSAWSKAGGYAPICYKKEVSKAQVEAWRQQHQASS